MCFSLICCRFLSHCNIPSAGEVLGIKETDLEHVTSAAGYTHPYYPTDNICNTDQNLVQIREQIFESNNYQEFHCHLHYINFILTCYAKFNDFHLCFVVETSLLFNCALVVLNCCPTWEKQINHNLRISLALKTTSGLVAQDYIVWH